MEAVLTVTAIEISEMNIARFEDGGVVEETTYVNLFELFEQLGVESPEK